LIGAEEVGEVAGRIRGLWWPARLAGLYHEIGLCGGERERKREKYIRVRWGREIRVRKL